MVIEPTAAMNLAPKRKAHSLTGRITLPLLSAAFKAVKANRGKAGIDKVSIEMFEANLADNLHALMRQLKDGSFEPYPLRRAFIPKNDTELRPLGIPAVRDRVAQEVVRRLLEPIFGITSAGVQFSENIAVRDESSLAGFCRFGPSRWVMAVGWLLPMALRFGRRR